MKELEQAIRHVENDEVEKGLALLKQALQKASHDEKFLIAEQLFTWGLLEDAMDIIDELLFLYPDEGQLYMLKAEILIDLEREEEAIEMLDEVNQNDPIYVQSLLLIADLYQMQGLSEVSESKLLEAKKLLPDELVIDFGLAEFYNSQGTFHKAIPYYELLLKKEKDMNGIDLRQRLAECLSGVGKFEEALPYFDQALKDKLEINTLFEYAIAAYQASHYQTAIDTFKQLKELDPQYHSLYLYLAKAYEHEEMLAEAYEAIKEGIAQDEFQKELYFYKGKLALKQGNEEEAEEGFKEAIALDPGYVEAILTLSKLYMSQERYEDVIENITLATQYNEYDPHFEWDLAKAYQETEQYKEALKHYETAYTVFKEEYAFLEEYGYFLLEEGERQKAKEIFTKLLSLDPTSIEIQDILFQLEE
ncbi:tetratricopeptide repeat protein [Metabacillus iocasae]|uniref:Tetratricopeptide (TPR) repeat protein n=1 Tax=Priestia iocasae TaxID=2291674 RepID=A0ABS2QQQ2_9BACI|nr:tetratricopeptide repeat protein [Metabacillus iocasae]MBM7701735.1 tetratricopeptide (TPR) repeat protein [Metabacillus iocasae]